MLIFNLCEILATLNFSQSEKKIREGSIKYFFEQLSFAYTSKAAAVYKILVIHFLNYYYVVVESILYVYLE